jgi:hypothetical protein
MINIKVVDYDEFCNFGIHYFQLKTFGGSKSGLKMYFFEISKFELPEVCQIKK